MPIENIPFPNILLFPATSDTVVTYGILENTNIGYIFAAMEYPTNLSDNQFYDAVNALKNTDGLIIDIRMNYGGMSMLNKGMSLLFNGRHVTMQDVIMCNPTTYELCTFGSRDFYTIEGGNDDSYDRPIAVLLGPSCLSTGENIANNLKYHPTVRFFGASYPGSIGGRVGPSFPGWETALGWLDTYHVNDPGNYLNGKEFPVDYPVWFNKDDVAKGIDPIVEKSLEWINNLAYGHNIVLNKTLLSAEKDTLKATATIENPNSHIISARLIFESLDGSVIDSTEMNPLNLDKKNDWQGNWVINDLAEDMYWVSLKVSDQTNETSFTNKHMTRITNLHLKLDSLAYKINSSSFFVNPFFKNLSSRESITNLKVGISSPDSWIKSISPLNYSWQALLSGQSLGIKSPFKISYDSSTFPGYFNLKFSILSDDWPLWVIDTTFAINPTGIIPEESLPLTFRLDQNFPNPFNSTTTIGWQMAQGEKVSLAVFDLLGRKVATLVDAYRSPGRYETKINAATLPKGIYFYQLKAGNSVKTRKMIVVK